MFDSVLACAKPAHAHVSEALLPALRTLSLSFLTNSSADSKAFQHFIVFSGSPTVGHHAFLFFDAKAWPQSQTDLFTCTTVLHCGNTFLRHIHLIYGITLWAYLPEPLVKDSNEFTAAEKAQTSCREKLRDSCHNTLCALAATGNGGGKIPISWSRAATFPGPQHSIALQYGKRERAWNNLSRE